MFASLTTQCCSCIAFGAPQMASNGKEVAQTHGICSVNARSSCLDVEIIVNPMSVEVHNILFG